MFLHLSGCAAKYGSFVQPEDYDVDDMYDYQGFDGYSDFGPKVMKPVDKPGCPRQSKKIKPSTGPSTKDRANP